MNRTLIYYIATAMLLTVAGCENNSNLESDRVTGVHGEYNTKVSFNLTIDQVEVGIGVTPIKTDAGSTRSGEPKISELWYLLFDADGTAVPSVSGEVMRHLTEEVEQPMGELLPAGEYRAVFLALQPEGKEMNDEVYSITSPDDKWLEINGNADGLYLYYDGMLSVRIGEENRMNVTLKPIVGEFKLDLQLASPEQSDEVQKIEVAFDKALPYLAFTLGGDFTTPSVTPLKGDATTGHFYSLPTAGEETSGKIIITLKGRDGKEENRIYSFSSLPIRRGEQTTLSLALDLAYNAMGTLYVDPKFTQSSSKMIMFQDNEPVSVYSDRNRRSFIVSSPLKATVREAKLEVQFYSPIGIKNVDLYMQLSGTSEWLKMCHFDVMPRFQEAYFDFKPAIQTATYETLSGKKVTIKADPNLTNWDVTFLVRSADPHFKKLSIIKPRWNVSFYNPSANLKHASTPSVANARHLIAFATNNGYMFSSDYFVQELEKWRGKLFGNGEEKDEENWPNMPEISKPVDIDKLLIDVYRVPKITYCDLEPGQGAVGRTWPGGYMSWLQEITQEHYTKLNSYETQAMFHEFGHVLGYPDFIGNMAINNKGWVKLCYMVYETQCKNAELPYYSADLVNNSK